MSKLTNGWDIMVANVCRLNRHSVSQVLFIVALTNILITGVIGLPLDQFYPFNNETDNRTTLTDDGGSPLLNLSVPFPFFGNKHFHIYVNNNAIISFNQKVDTYKPLNFNSTRFSTNNLVPLVAPYWTDTDIENVNTGGFGEAVLYTVTNTSDVITKAASDVNEYFQTTFTPTEVVIVTWYNVGYYGATEGGKNKRNLFQAVLITDGNQAYVVFNYNKTVWTTGSNSQGDPKTGLGGEPAVVGFYSGNSSLYYQVANSGTDAIINITKGSNVGIPGKFIYRVDGLTVDDLACRGSDTLTVIPENIPMLGQQPLRVKGPCLMSGVQVKARIQELGIEFLCQMIESNEAVCVTPPLFRTGEVTLEYDPDGTNNWQYNTILYVDHISYTNSPQFLVREKIDDWQSGKMVKVSWNESDIDAALDQDMLIDVLAYSNTDNEASFKHIQSVTVASEESSRRFKLVSDFSSYSTLIVRLCWNSELHPKTSPVCIWSDVFPVRWKSSNSLESEEWCQNWLMEEAMKPRLNIIRQSCPCKLKMAENDLGNFHVDPYCDIKNKQSANLTCVYNMDARKCFRRKLKSSIVNGEMCCYDNKNEELMDIRDGPGAGTHERYHYKGQGVNIVPFFSNFEEDLLPKLHCCQFSNRNCSQFIRYRNATTCAGYEAPSPAQAAGDPHIVTLDGKNYSFNAVGDFLLVKDVQSTFIVQVEATQALDLKGKLQNATVFTKIAVQMPNASDTVEIKKGDNGAEILVNGHTTSSTSQLKNISLSTNDDGSYLIVLEPISVSLTIYVTPDLINIIVLIGEDSLKGNLSGLLGNYNGDPSDDFTSRNGTLIAADTSMRDIHFDFGLTWSVPPSESIFASPPSTPLAGDLGYTPVFIDEINIGEEAVKEICGDNMLCKFDYEVTKKESVAKSTLEIVNKFKILQDDLGEKVIRCEYLEVPPNGNRTVSAYSNGSTATFTCDPGFEMIQGTRTRVCQNDSRWSGSSVACAIKVVEEENKTLLVAAVSTGTSVVVLIVIVMSVYCVRKRRKRKPKSENEDIPMSERNIPVFENPAFMQVLQGLVREGGFRIPRPNYVDPNIYQEYF